MSVNNLRPCYSCYGEETPKDSLDSESSWKSDVNVSRWLKPDDVSKNESSICSCNFKNSSGEYYKKYEHDEIPVKDNSSKFSNASFNNAEGRDSGRVSLTNSDLEKLENKIFKNMSQELQTDNSTISKLESNIKLLKTTVQEIFDIFYASKQDLAKNEIESKILAKNEIESIADMENLKKDMIHHIINSEISITNETCNRLENSSTKVKDIIEIKAMGDASAHSNLTNVIERKTTKLFDNYLTDSSFDDNQSELTSSRKEENFNIYLVGSVPCVQIKINDRNLLSEINIKNSRLEQEKYHRASADNMKKLADKKLEMEKYVKQPHTQSADREIPVKVSFAKKNICLNEDFSHEKVKDENKSFMCKICSYICKKLRKN